MGADEVELLRNGDARQRILVLAPRGAGGERLLAHLGERDADATAEVFVVVPALSGSWKQLANDDRDEIAAGGEDLDRLLAEVGESGRAVTGFVGDSDPRLALEDSLRQFAADAVVVVNPPGAGRDHPRGLRQRDPGGVIHFSDYVRSAPKNSASTRGKNEPRWPI